MRFGFCFTFSAQAKVVKKNKACGRTKAVETVISNLDSIWSPSVF